MTEFIKSKLEGKATEAPSIYAIQQGSAYLKVGDVGSSVVVCRELLNKKGYACDQTSETYDSALKSIVGNSKRISVCQAMDCWDKAPWLFYKTMSTILIG